MTQERLEAIGAELADVWSAPSAEGVAWEPSYTLRGNDVALVRDAIEILLELRIEHGKLQDLVEEVNYAVGLSDDPAARIARKLLER